MQTILDIDIDVFSWPTVYWPPSTARPSSRNYVCSSAEDVRYFLEQQCGLSNVRKIPGPEFVDHGDAFYTWRRWIQEGSLVPPFSIVHVDAHADMGLGDAGWVYLLSDLLALPVQRRREPRRGLDALNAGNYLMFAVANRWVGRLTYVFPVQTPWAANWASGFSEIVEDDQSGDGAPPDLMVMHFRNGDWKTGLLELKHCTRETLNSWMGGQRDLQPVIRFEPPVPFDYTPVRDFKFAGFTHMVVARSPLFAPPAADKLLPTIRDYFAAS
jgi:hypothetical protein